MAAPSTVTSLETVQDAGPSCNKDNSSSSSSWVPLMEEAVAQVWGYVRTGWLEYSRSCPVDPAVWLHPSMMQLMARVLSRSRSRWTMTSAIDVLHTPLAAAVAAGGVSGYTHPQLAAAAGRVLDGAMAAQAACVIRQVRHRTWTLALCSMQDTV
jgi:hypothetical protein